MKTAIRIAPVIILCLLLAGCPGANNTVATPTTPTPSSNQVINWDHQILSSVVTIGNTVKVLRDQGKLTETATVTIQNYLLVAGKCATDADAIAVQANGSNLTPAQKAAILSVWTSAGISSATQAMSPNSRAIANDIVSVVNTVFSFLGGPQL